MSRSFKKTPCDWGKNRKKWHKNQANRKVRNCREHIPEGAAYRRLYDSWLFREGMGYTTENDYRAFEVEMEAYWAMRRGEEPEDVESALTWWHKRFHRK